MEDINCQLPTTDIDNPIWETIDTNNVKQIHITP